MAHRGRDYRLHFRRDACIGCINYRNAWPLRWKIDGSFQLPGTGLPLQVFPSEQAQLVTAFDDHEPRWETPIVDIGDFSIGVAIAFREYKPMLGATNMTIEFFDGSGTVCSTAWEDGNFQQCKQYDRRGWAPADWNVAYFGAQPANLAFAARPVPYAEE